MAGEQDSAKAMHKQDKMRSRKGVEELLKLGADYVPSQRRSCKLAADGASSNRVGMDVALPLGRMKQFAVSAAGGSTGIRAVRALACAR